MRMRNELKYLEFYGTQKIIRECVDNGLSFKLLETMPDNPHAGLLINNYIDENSSIDGYTLLLFDYE